MDRKIVFFAVITSILIALLTIDIVIAANHTGNPSTQQPQQPEKTTSSSKGLLGDVFGPGGFIGSGSPASTGSGLFSDLLVDEDKVARKREEWDRKFAEMNLGTQYWTESFCAKKIERIPQGMMMANQGGYFSIIAHVEGEKIPISSWNDTTQKEERLYIYKFTVHVSNPSGPTDDPDFNPEDDDDRDMIFNVVTSGMSSPGKKIYEKPIILKDGETFYRKGMGMEVSYSKNDYDKICIKFTRPVRFYTAEGWEEKSEVCNRISLGGVLATRYVDPTKPAPEYSQYQDILAAAGVSGSGQTPSTEYDNGQDQRVSGI